MWIFQRFECGEFDEELEEFEYDIDHVKRTKSERWNPQGATSTFIFDKIRKVKEARMEELSPSSSDSSLHNIEADVPVNRNQQISAGDLSHQSGTLSIENTSGRLIRYVV